MRNKKEFGLLGIIAVLMLLAIFFYNSETKIEEKNSLTEENLNGIIKSVKTIEYGMVMETVDGIGKGSEFITFYSEYNIDGMATKRAAFDDKENMFFEFTNKYNEKNQVVNSSSKFVDTLGFVEKEYIYNENDQLIEEISYDENDEISGKKIYSYNDEGNNDSIINEDKNGNLLPKNEYIYDKNGNKSESIVTHYSTSTSSKTSHKIITHHESKNRKVYTYDKRGNEILAVSSNADKDSTGEWTSKYEKAYDRFDNVVKVNYVYKDYDDFSYIANIVYVYDEQNNWVESDTFKDGVSENRAVREIVYYEK